jgi:hypothetical protein
VTISYSLAPMPKWYIADLTGRPLGAGRMYTYTSLDKTVEKFIYQDEAGTLPWPNPVLFDENGSQGPFYWLVDSADPTDEYYIEVYDSHGVLQWTIDNFAPPSGSGGGGATTVIDTSNLVTNNIFWRGIQSASPIGATSLKIAPGNHVGLAPTTSLYGPDIFFKKNNTNATDTLTFPSFSVGSNSLTGDVTPQQYLNYTCTAIGGAGETFKYVQIPICKGVQNLQNVSVSFTLWGRGNSGTTTVKMYWAQFFGDGSAASATVRTLVQTLTLTGSWAQSTVHTTIPTISTKTLGQCGNDGLFLQLEFPLNATCNIDITKPCIYLGPHAPTIQFSSIDDIESLINSERTGHVIGGSDLAAPYGYLLMDDLTIGSASSAATSNPLSTGGYLGRSINTFPLYNLLWNSVSSPSGNTLCPVSGGLGASAIADFSADKTITLQAVLGRALASAGAGSGLTARTLGSIVGAETVTLSANNIPPLSSIYNYATNLAGGDVGDYTGGLSIATHNTVNEGSPNTPITIVQPTSFLNYFIKL